jgi:hypothetical protein
VVSFTARVLYPRERAPCTHWIGGWVGPRAGLGTASKRKIPSLRRDSNPDHPIVQPVVRRYTELNYPGSKVLPVLFLTEHNAMEAYWGSGGIAPTILDLSTR